VRKRKQNHDLFPHAWGNWREEGLIPIEGSKAYWKANNYGGYDLIANAKTVAYVKRVTYELQDDGIRSKDEVDHYVALVEVDTIEDLGQCQTSRDARQRFLDHLTEMQHGWDHSVEVTY